MTQTMKMGPSHRSKNVVVLGGRGLNVKIKKEKIIFFNRLMYPTKLAQQNNTFGNHEENERTKIYYCAV
jgi:hypothetical protein